MPQWPQLSWIDWTLLAVLGASLVVGLVRGFVFECLSLAGWVVAWFAAQYGAPELAPLLPDAIPGVAVRLGLAFALVFVGALVIFGLVAKLVRMLIHATPLSVPDRLLGAGFGVLRGSVLLLVVATVVGLTPAAQSPGWQRSQGARWLGQTLIALKPLLPAPAARLIPA